MLDDTCFMSDHFNDISYFKSFFYNNHQTEIKFLNKSCAPKATATPNNPKVRMGATLIPQNSKIETAPKNKIKYLKALINHFREVM